MSRWPAVVMCVALSATPGIVAADSALASETVSSLAQAMPRSPLSQESIYFVMTDRYSNGDVANDRGSTAIAGGLASGGYDATKDGWFHGGDLKGLTANLERVRRLGFTALWITPPFVNRAVQGSSAGYHGYWILDFTSIDPHFGTQADFDAFVSRAHELGLKVYVDIVMNHTADVIAYDDFTSFGLPGSKKPYVPKGLEDVKGPSWLNDLANYHNQGNIGNWSDSDQYRNGDFFGLDDVKTENEAVVDGFADVYSTWLVDHAVDGFRIDTAKHVDDAFFSRWIPALMDKVAGKAAAKGVAVAQPQIFGEVYDAQPAYLSSFMRQRGLPSVLDFGLQPMVVSFAGGSRNALSVDMTVAYDDTYNAGNGSDGFVRNAYGLPVFGGNHDMGRTAFLVQSEGGGSSPAHLLARTKLAYSILYTLRGAPVVYYGDEVGMIGTGGDKSAREDMFPTRVAAFAGEDRVGGKAIGKGSSLTASAEKLPMALHIRALNALRASHPALRNGALLMRHAKGQQLAWSRIDATARREYVVVANAADTPAKVSVTTSTPSTAFAAVFGAKATVKSSAKGALTLTVPARTLVVFRAGGALPATTAAPTLAVAAARDSELKAPVLTAEGTIGSDPVTVTFAARTCATCAWQALGSDDAAPFRMVLPSGAWAGGDSLEVVAISRTSDGKTAAGGIARLTRSGLA